MPSLSFAFRRTLHRRITAAIRCCSGVRAEPREVLCTAAVEEPASSARKAAATSGAQSRRTRSLLLPTLPVCQQEESRDERARGAVHREDGVGAEPRDAPADVSAHRDRQLRGAPRRHPRRARLGERRRGVVRPHLAGDPRDQRRVARHLGARPVLGQLGPDDLLLLRRRPRGTARVRRGRTAGTAAARPPTRRRARRHDRADRDLPRVQRRPLLGSRLRRRHVDRHRVRSRHARTRRAALPDQAARVHAHLLRRGRPARDRGDRGRLHHRAVGDAAPGRRRPPRRAAADRPRRIHLGAGVRRGWARRVGRDLEVGNRPRGRRARHGPHDLRVARRPRGPRARDRPLPPLPRAAHPRARPVGDDRRPGRDLAQRAPPAGVPSLDELRDRAAVRARKRRHPDRHRLPLAGLHLSRDARDHPGLRRRKADRHHRDRAARDRSSVAGVFGRRSGGPPWRGAASSPGSGSPSRC